MTTQYIGFEGEQLKQVQQAHVQMGSAIQTTLDTAFNQTDTFLLALEHYFGSATTYQSSVMAVLNSMLLAFRSGTYDLKLAAAEGATFAQAYTIGDAQGGRIKEDKDEKTLYHKPYVQKAQDLAKGGNKLVVEVMPGFFNLPYKGKDRDTQVEALLHELSHHAANTNDETVLGIPCYSWIGVKAAKFAGKAANNAENYGYFIASFQNFA